MRFNKVTPPSPAWMPLPFVGGASLRWGAIEGRFRGIKGKEETRDKMEGRGKYAGPAPGLSPPSAHGPAMQPEA